MNREVSKFIKSIEHPTRREDLEIIVPLMEKVSGYKGFVGLKSVCFGNYHYKYESGREGDSVVTAVSPRKTQIVLYIMPGFKQYGALVKKLGKHKKGSSCLYINKLADVDIDVLLKIVERSCRDMKKKYECWE
ncbi:MAG: DUF1801 domain-containing protein [Pseudomonadales bacterium]|nr:DUF1801 domain-containing protein [Pseudomonadales bacterium]